MTAEPEKTHVARSLKHDRALLGCRFDPTGRYVVAGSQDNNVVRWNLETGAKTVLSGHDSWVRPIAFSKDGATTISAGYDGRILWWPTTEESAGPIRKIQAHDGWVRAIDVSPDGALLASGGHDNKVKLFRAENGELLSELEGHTLHVYSVCFHPDGEFLLSGDLAGEMFQWELATGKLVRKFDAKDLHSYNGGQRVHYGGVRSITFSPDRSLVACSGLHKATNPLGAVQEPLVLLFDWQSAEKKASLESKDKLRGIAWRALFHPEGFLIGSSGSNGGGFLLFFRPDEKQEFHKLKVGATVLDFDLHPDGLRLASAHDDGKVQLSRMAPKPAEKAG